jgi:chromosomal replication initiation ATPase DnaA
MTLEELEQTYPGIKTAILEVPLYEIRTYFKKVKKYQTNQRHKIRYDHPLYNRDKELMHKVILKACEITNLDPDDIYGTRRYENISITRHVISYALNTYCFMTLSFIAHVLNRNHSTLSVSNKNVLSYLSINMTKGGVDVKKLLKDLKSFIDEELEITSNTV